MAKYNFTVSGGLLIVSLDEEAGKFSPETLSYLQASTELSNDKISLYDFGSFEKDFQFHNIGLVNGVAPTTIAIANSLILGLISTASANINGGGSSVQYNNVDIYDAPANLPITFPINTIHEIAILCITGTLTITVNGEQTVLSATQQTKITATSLINKAIVLNSTTGTFLATVLKE